MALIPPFFLDSVVALGFKGDDGVVRYQATGFLYGRFNYQMDENTANYTIFLVTNRHVLSKQTTAFLRFNPEGAEQAREFDLNLQNAQGDKLWFASEDVAIDVAIAPINASVLRKQGIQFGYFQNDRHALNKDRASELGLSEGDGVFVLGFPMGLVGEGRNYVIVRQGAIARVRDCLQGVRNDFLIDCPIFPGNSGSPVVTRPEITSIQGTQSINSANLIGVVSSYVPYQDVAVSQQTQRPRITFEENSGLATVFPIDLIDELIVRFGGEVVRPATEEVQTQTSDAEQISSPAIFAGSPE